PASGEELIADEKNRIPWDKLEKHHWSGLQFKLHPSIHSKPRAELEHEFREISALAAQFWLWLESRRLNRNFNSVQEYSLRSAERSRETSAWRNCLLNLKTFGPKAALDPKSLQYPRQRLLNSLPLLLWNG